MKPKTQPTQDDLHLFQAHFDPQLNPEHPLYKLAHQIGWNSFDQSFTVGGHPYGQRLSFQGAPS